MDTSDQAFMQLCQELAAEALAGGNAPVGAVVVYEHEVVGRGVESTTSQGRVTAHAELLALQAAREQLGRAVLDGCTLYSTHEPCVMCGYAIRYHRISRVVFRQASAYLGSCTSAFPVLLTTEVPPHWLPPPHVEQFRRSV